MHNLRLNRSLCDLVTDSCASIHLLEQRIIRHAARAHIAREALREVNGVAVLCAALHEFHILQRHFVFGGRIVARTAWRGVGHKSLHSTGSACACAGGTRSCSSQSTPKLSAVGWCRPAKMDCGPSCAGACGSNAGFGCEVGVSGIRDSSTTESSVVLLDRGPDEPRPQPAPTASTIADSRSVHHVHKAKA